jgi:hypothetical protein
MIFVCRIGKNSRHSGFGDRIRDSELAAENVEPEVHRVPSPEVILGYNVEVTIKVWLEAAIQDAERRGLSALRPQLEALARSTAALRTADWNFDATGEIEEPHGRDAR